MPLNLSKASWYWHRLRAMSPREVLLRLEKKTHQIADAKYTPPSELRLSQTAHFPTLPEKGSAPSELVAKLMGETEAILCGEWRAFGHLRLTMTEPLRWQADNLVNVDRQSNAVFFKLDHRAQPNGADIKVIWEPNRWYQLVRLAMAAWLLGHARAQEKCVEWLHHWATHNPPFTGLNWTSGLETGIRLIQFTWIDAFLNAAGVPRKTLEELRTRVLAPHIWYTWRYKSFGSSANNHLIGELAGLIIALARWPELSKISAPLEEIGGRLDREILAQFAPDGGNREQALGYHLFSWEFCFQAQAALAAAGHPLSSAAAERLKRAAEFYRAVKLENDPWDFGDSDNAWVTPLFADEQTAAREWWWWFGGSASSTALSYWWGDSKNPANQKAVEWKVFPESGYAVFNSDDWFVRFDFSSLGYLSMAPHGHLDALHLSISYQGKPIIIDPGTGAYYSEKTLRSYLADWAAHNSPHLKNPPRKYPARFGIFLWGAHHKVPSYRQTSPLSISAEIELPYGTATREVTYLPERNAIKVKDRFVQHGTHHPVVTRWKFAPEWKVERIGADEFRSGPVRLQPSASWKIARTYNPPDDLRGRISPSSEAFSTVPLESLVSPAFRAVTAASYLALESSEEGPLELLISPG